MSNYSGLAKQIANDIIKNQEEKMRQAVAYVAQKVSEDWAQKARGVMDAYYSDYQSDDYDRTNQLRDSIMPVMVENGNTFITGMEFDISKMDHTLNTKINSAFGSMGTSARIGEVDIFKNFMYGAHGNEDYTVPGTGRKIRRDIHFTSPSAIEVLDGYYNSYHTTIDRFWKEALLKVK